MQQQLLNRPASTVAAGRGAQRANASLRWPHAYPACRVGTHRPLDNGQRQPSLQARSRAPGARGARGLVTVRASSHTAPGQLHTPVQSEKKRHEQHDGVVQRAVNSGMGFIVGDILAQRLTGEAFDAVRSLELGLYGTLLDGPVIHMFNRVVDRAVGTGARAKLAKAAADNAIWMPVTTCLLFAALKLAQGEPEEIASGLQDKMLSMAVANHVLWPLAKFVNAKLVPKQHQPVANKVVQVVWSAWLSTLGHAPSVMDLADSQNVHQFTDTASLMVDKFVPDHIHAVVSDAVNASVENFVSPFLQHAADAMESASDVMERLPSAFLDKAFSKSLDVVTPFERMAS
ncbi:hypothetical protein ABBQ32_007009 [Trebouxia sp. C0010 RCD-2024]